MAPTVPFALLGVVQIAAVAGWIGLAGGASFPRLRRHVTPAFVVGALALAAADALTAVRFGDTTATDIAWLRVGGVLLLALGAAGGAGQSLVLPLPAATGAVVVPLGGPTDAAVVGGIAGIVGAAGAWRRSLRASADRVLGAALAGALLATGLATALSAPARDHASAALAVLAIRALATVLVGVVLVQLARVVLLGKLLGAILAGVVAMAAGAVGVVGTGVANEVQAQQSQRLLQVAQSQAELLGTLGTRAGLFAQITAACPTFPDKCVQALRLFSEQPDYFAVIVEPRHGAKLVLSSPAPIPDAALVQLAGSNVVQGALQPGATAQTTASGALLLPGTPPTLAVVAAAPGRPGGSSDARIKPTFAAVYGIGVVDPYLRSLQRQTGYDVSVIADGHVIASSLPSAGRAQVLDEATSGAVERADAVTNRVIPARGNEPTAAFVPITGAGNDDLRIATLAVSQPANEALRAQRSVLQRMFVTALVALIVVAVLAGFLARRIADPIRRLTVATGRVRRGDLETTTSVSGRDEVGMLARGFDAMTESLRRLTGDLRATAEQEAALRARLQTVVESMSDGLVVTDGRGRVTSANPTALRLLALDADAVVGRLARDVVRVRDDEGRSVLEHTDRRSHDGILVTADGGQVPVRVGVAPLAEGRGRVVILADRTREREVERMKSEFLANVSHELRTPLTPIRGYAEILSRRSDLSRPQVEQFLDEILSSTARMSRAVELLVDVAALEGDRVATSRRKVSVRALVDQRMAVWRDRYPERADDLRRRVANGLPAVDIDPHWVERALDELADNAVKYTPAGSTITLAAASSDDGRHVRVSLRDAGPGFDPQRAAELASDFSQADASETRRVGGMGLGLGFVSRVADRFDLHLSIDSEPGNGAEFALLLPVLKDDARDGTDGAGSEVQGPAGGRDGRGALRRTTTTRARAARKTASRSDR